jgi:hypothetical protein
MLSAEPIFRLRCEVAEILSLGPTPYGERRIINILGGPVEGPRLSGRILPGGADWQIIRQDGVADLKARYTIETVAGARVLVASDGMRHGPPDVIAEPLLLPHRDAVRDRRPGRRLAQQDHRDRPRHPRGAPGADRRVRGAVIN